MSMPYHQYMTLETKKTGLEFNLMLAAYGKQQWELVSVVRWHDRIGDKCLLLFFKRQVLT